MENIAIRQVSLDDVDFLFHLMNEPTILQRLHEVPTERSDWQEAVSAWSEDADEEDFIVCNNDVPVGWFAINGLLSDNRKPYLKMAVLLCSNQSKGIGSYVLKQIIRNLKLRGFDSLALYTDRDNHAAQKCYGKCGFVVKETLIEPMSDGTMTKRYKMECNFLMEEI